MAAPVKSNGWLAGMISCVVLMLNGAFQLTTLLPTNLVKWDLCFTTFSRLFPLPFHCSQGLEPGTSCIQCSTELSTFVVALYHKLSSTCRSFEDHHSQL